MKFFRLRFKPFQFIFCPEITILNLKSNAKMNIILPEKPEIICQIQGFASIYEWIFSITEMKCKLEIKNYY